MAKGEPLKYYLVESSVLPEIFLKVAAAKEYLQTGECATVGEARVLGVFAHCGANILTINQSIPVNGCATITISAETASMTESTQKLMNDLLSSEGVLRAEVVAG